MRPSSSVMSCINIAERLICAKFDPSKGQLRVTDGSKVLHTLDPPDSWLAIASVSQSSGWGTHPAEADLKAYLEAYAASLQQSEAP